MRLLNYLLAGLQQWLFPGLNLGATLPSSLTDVPGIARFFLAVLDVSWNRLLIETGKVIGPSNVGLLVLVIGWAVPLVNQGWDGILALSQQGQQQVSTFYANVSMWSLNALLGALTGPVLLALVNALLKLAPGLGWALLVKQLLDAALWVIRNGANFVRLAGTVLRALQALAACRGRAAWRGWWSRRWRSGE